MYRNIVVGTDGSATARQAVREAIAMAATNGATLHVVTVTRPVGIALDAGAGVALDGQLMAAFGEHSGEAMTRTLDEAESDATDAGVAVVRHACIGDPAMAIVEVIERVEADIVVVGNRGMQGFRRLLGSVPNRVAHRAPCAVHIVATV